MNEKIERITFLLKEAYKTLIGITELNFDNSMRRVKTMLKESQEHKSFLLTHYSGSELRIFEPDLTKLAKQIKECFDNIIENKKIEIASVRLNMEYTQNRKKLVNYIR